MSSTFSTGNIQTRTLTGIDGEKLEIKNLKTSDGVSLNDATNVEFVTQAIAAALIPVSVDVAFDTMGDMIEYVNTLKMETKIGLLLNDEDALLNGPYELKRGEDPKVMGTCTKLDYTPSTRFKVKGTMTGYYTLSSTGKYTFVPQDSILLSDNEWTGNNSFNGDTMIEGTKKRIYVPKNINVGENAETGKVKTTFGVKFSMDGGTTQPNTSRILEFDLPDLTGTEYLKGSFLVNIKSVGHAVSNFGYYRELEVMTYIDRGSGNNKLTIIDGGTSMTMGSATTKSTSGTETTKTVLSISEDNRFVLTISHKEPHEIHWTVIVDVVGISGMPDE